MPPSHRVKVRASGAGWSGAAGCVIYGSRRFNGRSEAPVGSAGRQRHVFSLRAHYLRPIHCFSSGAPKVGAGPFLTFLPVFVCARRSSFNDAHDKKQKDVGRQVSLTKTRALIKFSDWSGDQFGRPVLMAHFMQMNGPAVCCVSTWTRSRDESASAEIKSSLG